MMIACNDNMAISIRIVLNRYGLDIFGFCHFDDLFGRLLPCRAARRLPRNPRSVIVVLFPYYVNVEGARNVARYVIPDDYHIIAGGILAEAAASLHKIYPKEEFATFIDDSPIPEKYAAHLAGLGFIGRHSQLINREFGAYVFIGTIVTTMATAPSEPVRNICLDNCAKCIESCPTGAISRDKPFERSLCLSAISQKKALTSWEEQQMRRAGIVWGCDICLEACPLNILARESPIDAFKNSSSPWIDPENIDEIWPRKAYNYRPKEVLLRNYYLTTE